MQADLPAPVTSVDTADSIERLHLVVDSYGVKVSGEGEWKFRKYSVETRRQWRKVQLAVDKNTGVIHAVRTTGSEIADGAVLPDLLQQVAEPVAVVRADGHLFQMTVAVAIGVRVTPRFRIAAQKPSSRRVAGL